MKIRDQNYSQETAALLRDISMYRALREGQGPPLQNLYGNVSVEEL